MSSHYFLGIDSGSISTDAVVINAAGAIAGVAVEPTRGNVERATACAVAEAFRHADVHDADIAMTVACGYGRYMVKRAAQVMTEISCHARGVHHLFPHERHVLDIGGEDAKVIVLDATGHVADFAMNTKCAAGTGRFLEAIAERLGYSLASFIEAARVASAAAAITSTCTVFAESEVVSLVAAGTPVASIARGIHTSIAARLQALCAKVHTGDRIVLTGGVALNPVIADILRQTFHLNVIIPDNPQIIGALGAALYARSFVATAAKK